MEFLQELNEQQKQAVYEEHPRICVIAGPGCGKTKTLVSRLIYLLASQKAQPQNILVLTFAKKAIKEIKKRVFSYITTISPKDLHIYNFHSFCFHVLNKYSYLLGFPDSKFPVYDRYEQEAVIRKILYQNNYNAEKKEINTILACIGGWKNGKLDDDPFQFDELTKVRYEIYQKYEEYLKINKALDFNDLLLYTITLFNYHSQVRQDYQAQFNHILLDEFQDINNIQWEVIKLILSEKQNVFLVGDPNQAIYGFQGATPELISSFTKNKEWKTIYLNTNYRSTSSILHLSNSFIQKNQAVLVNNLLNTSKPEGTKVRLLTRTPIRFIIRHARWLLVRERLQFSDIAILYRNNYLSMRLEQELVAQKIPYEILGSFKFIEREEIKDALSFLRTIIYQDNISLLRILGLQEKIGARTIEKIEQNSEKERLSIYEYLNNFATITNLSQEKWLAGQIEKISAVILKINKWREKLEQKTLLNTFLLGILNDFNYWEHLKTRINFTEREKNVQQFLNIVQNWENKRKKEYPSLGELLNSFLQWIIIAFEDKKLIKTRNNLILSSVHQAKGLEFEMVFFVYLDQGILPYKETQDITEEKRLFYVGITRAKRLLYLISSQELHSPFLDEIDNNYLVKNDN
ncbi:MAG: ATP-dependent helicase [Candidatus Moeniiplasma glomeromycotorum]|nr:ATP-dependent helicase [Candidatus Moeniiplasma glomeromycotorum]MCE8167968.1 ATP-dependent helicase [Candidatus Moeniiplasma glomeromycotorum]MCE8169197.1 ATP-dependent helicase [Candidatus Moeniiplasma glomeromycotorum]